MKRSKVLIKSSQVIADNRNLLSASSLSFLKICAMVVPFAFAFPAEAAKVNFRPDTNNNNRLSEIIKNPDEVKFGDQTVYRFQIEHGGCGGDDNWSDCDNDRQRVELKDGYKVSLQTFSQNKNSKRYYRTNLLIPSEEKFPDTAPMKQMIHQKKLQSKNNPIWMVFTEAQGGLRIETDSSGSCSVDRQLVPRGKWLEIEIHANYELYSSEKLQLAQEAFFQSRNKNYQPRVDPAFRYFINGKQVCTLWNPLITKAGLRDGGKRKLQLKFGIYNSAVSRWLLAQQENRQWVERNGIEFTEYRQASKGERNGAIRTRLGTPFAYDWPVKLPTQTLYYTDWYMTKDAAELPPSRYVKTKANPKLEGCSDPVFAKMMGAECE